MSRYFNGYDKYEEECWIKGEKWPDNVDKQYWGDDDLDEQCWDDTDGEFILNPENKTHTVINGYESLMQKYSDITRKQPVKEFVLMPYKKGVVINDRIDYTYKKCNKFYEYDEQKLTKYKDLNKNFMPFFNKTTKRTNTELLCVNKLIKYTDIINYIISPDTPIEDNMTNIKEIIKNELYTIEELHYISTVSSKNIFNIFNYACKELCFDLKVYCIKFMFNMITKDIDVLCNDNCNLSEHNKMQIYALYLNDNVETHERLVELFDNIASIKHRVVNKLTHILCDNTKILTSISIACRNDYVNANNIFLKKLFLNVGNYYKLRQNSTFRSLSSTIQDFITTNFMNSFKKP